MLDPYKQQPNFFLPHPNHYDHPDQHRHRQRNHRQHRSAAVAGRRAVGPPMPPPPPQRVPSPNCCSSSAATSSVVSEPISLDLATEQYFVKEKENWAAGRFSRRVPPRPLRRTAGAEQHGLVIPLDRFRTKNFSRHPNNDAFDSSDDEYYDEGDFGRRRRERFDWHARRYSTSDLTTSDSELGRLGTGKPYRLGIKCPSVSTINPDDSSLSFEDLEQQMIYQQPIKLGGVRRYHRHQPNQKQRRGVISTVTNFYDFDDDDGTENCGAKSDAELTDRAPPSHRYRSGSHRMLQRRMNAAADDGGSPPPSRGTQSAPRTPQRHAVPPALEMIEEISPILPRPVDVRDDLDIPPLPRPLKLSKEWRPLQTSTLTNFHATLPKTNPHHSSATKLPPIAPLEPPRSLFDPQYTAMCFGTTSDEFKPIRSEQFNLPSVMAKAKGIRGILFLQLCVSGDSVLKVQIRNGAYFLKSLPISSFVKLEIRRSISNRRRDKYAHHHEKRQRFCSRVTYPVSQNNQPEFYEEFMFRVTRTHLEHGDKLGISVFVQHSGEEKTPELLGGMSFSLVKMMKMAQLHTTSSQQCFFHYDDHQSHLPMGDVTVKLYEGGFFLLPDKKALTSKFAQDKISIRKYYDDIGGSTTMSTTASSSMGSPFRMMNEPEWTTAVARFGIGGAGGAGGVMPTAMGAPNLRNGCGPPPLPRRLFSPSRKASATYHHQHHHNPMMALAPPASAQLPATAVPAAASCAIGGESSAADTSHYTTSNSSSSGAQSAVDCKRTRGGCGGTVATATTVGCPTVIDRLAPANGASAAAAGVAQQPPAVPPPSVNTTDSTTSDFTSSGFTSSSPTNCGTVQMLIGHQHHQQLPTMAPGPIETSSSLANSFSSGCAEVGAGGADAGGGSSSSDESSSSSSSSASSSPVVVELATNDVGPVPTASADGQQQQFRKASLQHHYSPMRVHRGGGNGGNRSSPQKVGPTSPLKQQQASSAELVDPYNNNNNALQQPQQSSSPTTKRRGGGGRLRSALAATTDNTMVRRVASFTFSPPLRAGSLQHNQLQHQLQQQQFLSALDKHCNSSSSNNSAAGALRLDKRNSVASGGGAGGTDKLQRRMALGPLSKTLHFLRTKLDFSMSASVLCPSREDCRLWQESFDALLAHKYGCLLFREFLQSEFSEENLEFWLECEQFKRMKPAKKSTGQKANQIYDTFIRELAPKEVNLDSQTRLATQAALSVVPLRADMFMLAQQKIGQLMAKDSYPRFLKSEQYLELLNNNNNNNNGNNNNENDGGEHMQQPKGLLRVASAREGCAVTTKSLSSLSGASCSRSPSLSPRSGGAGAGRWHTRRNTCAPTTTPMPMLAGTHTKKGATGAGNNGTIATNTLSSNSGAGGPTPLTLQIPSIAE